MQDNSKQARVETAAPATSDFPWRILLISAIVWLLPMVLYFINEVYITIFPGTLPILTIVFITMILLPIFAVIFYYIDLRRADGYVTRWGYR